MTGPGQEGIPKEMKKIVDVCIRGVPLPETVNGCILPNGDGSYDIYYNSRMDKERCRRTVEHELQHLRREHLYDCNPVWRNEQEAEER